MKHRNRGGAPVSLLDKEPSMNNLNTLDTYAVRQLTTEKVLWTSPEFRYEVCEPISGHVVLTTQEPPLSWLLKLFRRDRRYRGHTPLDVSLMSGGQRQLRLTRGISILLSKIQIFDKRDALIAVLTQRFSPIHAHLELRDNNGKLLFTIRGDWADWDFKVLQGTETIATISKGKGEGLVSELFTTRDSYIVHVNEHVPTDSALRPFIAACAIAVDIACNE